MQTVTKARAYGPSIAVLFFFLLPGCEPARPGREQILAELGVDQLLDREMSLVARFAAAPKPREVIALIGGEDGWGNVPDSVEVFVYDGWAELIRYKDGSPAWQYHRKVSLDEIGGLKRFLEAHGVHDLADFDGGADDVPSYTFLHLSSNRRKQLFMIGALVGRRFGKRVDHVYAKLIDKMYELADPDRLEYRYAGSRPLTDMKVAFAHCGKHAVDIWADGNDVRVSIEELEDGQRVYKWYALAGGRLGKSVDEPEGLYAQPVQDKDADYGWIRKVLGQDRLHVDRKLSPDGRWLVGRNESGLYCFDLEKRVRMPVDREVSDFSAVEYVPAQKRFLLARPDVGAMRYPSHTVPWVFRTLDPATGKSTECELDNVNPFSDFRRAWRPLQPAGRENVVWFAWYDPHGRDDETIVARFDMERLHCHTCNWVSGVRFSSNNMWVDARAGLVYILHKGAVLTAPLSKDALIDLPEPN